MRKRRSELCFLGKYVLAAPFRSEIQPADASCRPPMFAERVPMCEVLMPGKGRRRGPMYRTRDREHVSTHVWYTLQPI